MSDEPDLRLGPVYVPSRAPGKVRPTLINVDSSGLAMSWSTARWALAGLAVLISTGYAAVQSLVFRADLEGHNADPEAHLVTLERSEDPMPVREVLKKHENVLRGIPTLVAEQHRQDTVLEQIRKSMYEERAEHLADDALKRLPSHKHQGVWEHVRETAIANQYGGRPIRTDLRRFFE